METDEILNLIKNGENFHVEFKRCGNGFEKDVFETVCAFSNRFGGEILCGVLDDGKIEGLPEKAVPNMIKNFVNVTSEPNLFNPILYITPQVIKIDGKTIIHIHVPISSDVHSYKGKIYDRVHEADIIVKSNSKIAEMIIRKQNLFTEQKVFPYATMNELKPELIEQCRKLAVNLQAEHPWKDMSDEQLLKSAGLIKMDLETGKTGINLAGLLLLGRDDVIRSVCPQYKTDALLRRVNVDRYDDREIIETNLIESYELLMQFVRKHLNDKFYLEGVQRVNLRDKIAREMISNILMHREFTSAYISKLVIEKDKMYTENPCKALNQMLLTPENFTPISKNPIIAKFFTNIGYADELGSGIRNMFKYTMLYSGKYPEMREDDIFKTIIPLDDNYSTDYGTPLPQGSEPEKKAEQPLPLSGNQQNILNALKENPKITQTELAEKLNLSRRAIQTNLKILQDSKKLERVGSKKDGLWIVR